MEEGEIDDSDSNEADNHVVKGPSPQGQKLAVSKKKAAVIEELEDGEIVSSDDEMEKEPTQQQEEQNEKKKEMKPVTKKPVSKANPVVGSALMEEKKNMENKENRMDKKKKGVPSFYSLNFTGCLVATFPYQSASLPLTTTSIPVIHFSYS